MSMCARLCVAIAVCLAVVGFIPTDAQAGLVTDATASGPGVGSGSHFAGVVTADNITSGDFLVRVNNETTSRTYDINSPAEQIGDIAGSGNLSAAGTWYYDLLVMSGRLIDISYSGTATLTSTSANNGLQFELLINKDPSSVVDSVTITGASPGGNTRPVSLSYTGPAIVTSAQVKVMVVGFNSGNSGSFLSHGLLSAQSVPEPSSLILLGLTTGAIGFAVSVRRYFA